MAFDYSRLSEITTISDTPTVIYTNPSGIKSYIRLIMIHNTNTIVENIELWNVPDSSGSVGAVADINKIFKDSLDADGTLFLEFAIPGIILEDLNDTIQAKTTTASKVTIQIMGGSE